MGRGLLRLRRHDRNRPPPDPGNPHPRDLAVRLRARTRLALAVEPSVHQLDHQIDREAAGQQNRLSATDAPRSFRRRSPTSFQGRYGANPRDKGVKIEVRHFAEIFLARHGELETRSPFVEALAASFARTPNCHKK
jgi:hypothetical protein